VNNPVLAEVLYLCKNGVPWEVAWELDRTHRKAYYIIIGQFDGNVWDWDKDRFLTIEERKAMREDVA